MRKAYKARSVQFNAKARLQSKFQCNSLLQNAWILLQIDTKISTYLLQHKWINLYSISYACIRAILATSNQQRIEMGIKENLLRAMINNSFILNAIE